MQLLQRCYCDPLSGARLGIRRLLEDGRKNQAKVSIDLYRQTLHSKLLANVHVVLLLNKADLLKRQMEAGVPLAPHHRRYHVYRKYYQDEYRTGTESSKKTEPNEPVSNSRKGASAVYHSEYEYILAYFTRRFRPVAAED